MSRLNTMYPNDEFLKDISNVIGKVDSKNETQIKKEIEQVGYKEFYRYYKEKDIYIKQLQQENQELKKQIEEYKRLGFKHLNDKCNELENQQKEFISYLEEKEKEFDILGDPKNAGACKGILRKYQETIGVSNEK